jgi:hypothetical protein
MTDAELRKAIDAAIAGYQAGLDALSLTAFLSPTATANITIANESAIAALRDLRRKVFGE